MEYGQYRTNPIDFSKFEVSKATLHLFDRSLYASAGCGACALGLLTGENPLSIAKKYNYKKHWSDIKMVDFLNKKNFTVLPITKCDVTQSETYIKYPIANYHVVLISQLVIKNEASWSIFYSDYIFHNFEIRPLKPLELLNNPILSAYLIFKKEWK